MGTLTARDGRAECISVAQLMFLERSRAFYFERCSRVASSNMRITKHFFSQKRRKKRIERELRENREKKGKENEEEEEKAERMREPSSGSWGERTKRSLKANSLGRFAAFCLRVRTFFF